MGYKFLAVGALLALGMSPSWVTWEKFPDKRPSMLAYYIVMAVAIWFGVQGWIDQTIAGRT